MMGPQLGEQPALFYEFSLERNVPADHQLRSIDRFVDLEGLRQELSAFYSTIGRPSVAPELMIPMLLVGYCIGIRSNGAPYDGTSSPLSSEMIATKRCENWSSFSRTVPTRARAGRLDRVPCNRSKAEPQQRAR